jgi:hypothetical protein
VNCYCCYVHRYCCYVHRYCCYVHHSSLTFCVYVTRRCSAQLLAASS